MLNLYLRCIGRAQGQQKTYYDKKSHLPNFAEGDRVFLFKPAEKTGEARKLSRPYHGPYRVVQLDTNTAHIRRVDRPQDDTILVALHRLRRYPLEIGYEFWPPDKKTGKASSKSPKSRGFVTRDAQMHLPTCLHTPTERAEALSEDLPGPGLGDEPTDMPNRPVDQHVTPEDKTPLRADLSVSAEEEQDGAGPPVVKSRLLETPEEPQDQGRKLKWTGRLRSHRRLPAVEDA